MTDEVGALRAALRVALDEKEALRNERDGLLRILFDLEKESNKVARNMRHRCVTMVRNMADPPADLLEKIRGRGMERSGR
ncbi:MAG: hypothetical protein ACYTEQ_31345 [Planctomycetota bacterium]|jgi:hypothetical protein